jgi:hypothetical protein
MFIYKGPAQGLAACPATMALHLLEAHAGTPTATHSCSACSCGSVQGTSCQAWLSEYSESGCGGANYEHVFDTSCWTIFNGNDSVRAHATAYGGSCTPSGGTLQAGAPTWAEDLRGCAAPTLLSDGCAVGEVCAPVPVPPFGANLCVANTGDAACPDGYTVKISGSGGVTDTRGCTECACGDASGVSCTGTLLLNNASGCGGGTTLPIPLTSCTATSGNRGVKVQTLSGTGGSCPQSGGALTGSLAPKDLVTVCCLP